MVKIDPIHYLLNTILDDKEAIIFLGGGASMEGKQKEKKFPGYDDLIDRVLQKYKVKPKNKKDRLNSFFSIIEQWEKEKKLAARLREFLDGEPGLAHYHLAALSIALFGESNTLLYLTKNFDDLINQTFIDLKKNQVRKFTPVVIPLHPKLPDSEFQEIAITAEANLKKGFPVILKLFGDLNFQKPILRQDDINFEPEVKKKLMEWMAKPMIVIGYSFSDKKIRELLIASGGTSPIFMINPLRKIHPAIKDTDRVHHIKSNFSDFVNKLLEIFQERNPAINRKIDKILQFLDPTKIFPDFNSIENRVRLCSKASILRAEERIPKIEVNGKVRKLVPISRKDTSPDFERFLQSDKQLLAVIGDSGSGKSTLLYRIAKNDFNKRFITLFYDVHHLQITGSLTERLSQDLRCVSSQLESILEHFDKILTKENKKLMVIIDGLNESTKIDPSDLKIEIEDLEAKLPKSIKIVYSCRTVYWNSYIKVNTPISSTLYYGSKEFILYFYSKIEAKRAFETYKNLFEFQGSFESLKEEFKEKIRDPLMLRMLAEGYQGKKLPTFAPAVKIFRSYEETLKRKFKGNPFLIDFMHELIATKSEEIKDQKQVSDQFIARKIRTNLKFSNLFQLAKPKDPLVLLEDEGILSLLDEDETTYRFTYDRFFEYLLGKAIGKHFNIYSKKDFIKILSEKILVFQRIHFSFIQALKSEIIRRNIENSSDSWSFYDPATLRLLLNHPDAAIVNFTKEVLRELTFEAERNTLEALKGATDSELDYKLLTLDIASDSPKIRSILIEGLFSGHKYLTRRCVQILSILNLEPRIQIDFEELIISKTANSRNFKKEHAMGLIYYTSTIFSVEDQRGNDPFIRTKFFWKKVLLSIKADIEEVKEIIKSEFTRIVKDEGPNFFGEGSREHGMEYIWKGMSKDEREVAIKLIPLIIDPNKTIDFESQEIIKFFGSSIKEWKKRKEPEKNERYSYKFEYRLAEWILIQRSQRDFDEVKKILDHFVSTGFWKSIDFALCNMRYILQIIYDTNMEIVKDGFKSIKDWTEKLRQEDAEKFYYPVEESDPFLIDQNFIALAAIIDTLYFAPKEGPIAYLEEKLTSKDKRDVRLALLSVRYLWQDNPRKVLGTLELLANTDDRWRSHKLSRFCSLKMSHLFT
ncbi:MAG: SIR2 family protein [Candidatus Aminicenantes bacterium]|jgi:GTPase SAR1 family protein